MNGGTTDWSPGDILASLLMWTSHRLINQFDRKDPMIHFMELAQLKQIETPNVCISEFQLKRYLLW